MAGVVSLSQQSTLVVSSLAFHDYEEIALHAEEKPRLQANLGQAHFLMLRNHGLLRIRFSNAPFPSPWHPEHGSTRRPMRLNLSLSAGE